MSKFGQRLIESVKELRDAMGCDHEWYVNFKKDRQVRYCRKCGLRMTSFNKA